MGRRRIQVGDPCRYGHAWNRSLDGKRCLNCYPYAPARIPVDPAVALAHKQERERQRRLQGQRRKKDLAVLLGIAPPKRCIAAGTTSRAAERAAAREAKQAAKAARLAAQAEARALLAAKVAAANELRRLQQEANDKRRAARVEAAERRRQIGRASCRERV